MGKRIVLTTFGSLGDLHPYMAIALELKARGHQPVIATSNLYQEKIENEGIGFHAMRPDLPPLEEARDMITNVMHAKTGPEYLFKNLLMPHLRESYEDLMCAVQNSDLLISHPVTLAGPIVAEKLGLKWVSIVLAPISLWSAHDPPVLPAMPALARLHNLGPGVHRALLRLAKRMTLSWIPKVTQLREELGLPVGEHPIFEGQHSPYLVLALFSSVLAQPQPDWPPHTRVTGYCFYDRKDVNEQDGSGLVPELKQFLENGTPPIVFTLGSSAVFDARNFFHESIASAQQLGRRAVLLIGDEQNRPVEPLPDGIIACHYAPYSELFPHAAAIVHQGGAGTTGQALRAGKPMLVMPYSHDQPDHAARMVRLGIGRTLRRRKYSAARAATELSHLLNEPEYSQKAAEIGHQVQRENGPRAACDAIEECLNL